MTRRMVIMLILVGLLFGAIFGFRAFKAYMMQKAMMARGVPAQSVSAIKASEDTWQTQFEAVGSLRAFRGADIAPEVSGIVSRIHFKSGQEVDAGALLVELNADADIAKLRSLQAIAELAKQTYERDQQQFKDKTVSQATLDSDAANLKNADAQVAEQQALVDKKTIRAPFAGRLGIRAIDLGQYLNAGTQIVTLQALDPIYDDFYLPQKSVSQVAIGQKVSVKADAFPGQVFDGEITAINPKVDVNTRNVQIRARIHNPKSLLLPGMFATTEIKMGKSQRYVTLPQTAITYNPYGSTVFLVEARGAGPEGKPALVAQEKFVTTGETRGDQVMILDGVNAGDMVVTSGQIKLRSGTPVVINNTIEPANEAAPQVKDE
jgi:membrane fusion protein (multidrug efflux system)